MKVPKKVNGFSLLVAHMMECLLCQPYLGKPIYEIHIHLCFQAQQLIAKEQMHGDGSNKTN